MCTLLTYAIGSRVKTLYNYSKCEHDLDHRAQLWKKCFKLLNQFQATKIIQNSISLHTSCLKWMKSWPRNSLIKGLPTTTRTPFQISLKLSIFHFVKISLNKLFNIQYKFYITNLIVTKKKEVQLNKRIVKEPKGFVLTLFKLTNL